MKNISFIGDGGWGTTLAIYLARKGFPVTLYGAFSENVESMRQHRENQKFLPGMAFPETLSVTDDLLEAIDNAEIIVLSTPSQYLEHTLKRMKKIFDHLTSENKETKVNPSLDQKIFLSVVKGIENAHLLRMSELIYNCLGDISLAVLSGPTIATEVALGIPSSAVIASKSKHIAGEFQQIFHSDTFRIYTNSDIIGVELGGSLKNVMAIACGVCDGLGYGTNTKSALLTRGLSEMSRLGKAMGAKTATFAGLAGMGDLITTCFSTHSRNRSVGEQLGKGYDINTILKNMTMVAEGVETAKAAQKLSRIKDIETPIISEVYNIIYKRKPPQKAVSDLMTRTLKSE
jgi:glycerol-3-phosphate dehydrogenase (NAD(P)+)